MLARSLGLDQGLMERPPSPAALPPLASVDEVTSESQVRPAPSLGAVRALVLPRAPRASLTPYFPLPRIFISKHALQPSDTRVCCQSTQGTSDVS